MWGGASVCLYSLEEGAKNAICFKHKEHSCCTVIACKNVCSSTALLKYKKECPFVCALGGYQVFLSPRGRE